MTELLIMFILICIVISAVLVFSLGTLIGSTIYISYLERRNTNGKENLSVDRTNKLSFLEPRKNYKLYNEDPNKNFKNMKGVI